MGLWGVALLCSVTAGTFIFSFVSGDFESWRGALLVRSLVIGKFAVVQVGLGRTSQMLVVLEWQCLANLACPRAIRCEATKFQCR